MRQVVLDTETTGRELSKGHRIIEIGCVEIVDRRITERRFHVYLNPGREIDEQALRVHGITAEFLKDKPTFGEVVDRFLQFIRGSELVIHNAPFDVGFLNMELSLLGGDYGRIEDYCTVLDTLLLARKRHPGQRNSLDALCKRYGIDNHHRDLHGALLDAELLAQVYLAMTGGQASLFFGAEDPKVQRRNRRKRRLTVLRPSDEELEAHRNFLKLLEEEGDAPPLW